MSTGGRFGDCASCFFIETKVVEVTRAYHSAPATQIGGWRDRTITILDPWENQPGMPTDADSRGMVTIVDSTPLNSGTVTYEAPIGGFLRWVYSTSGGMGEGVADPDTGASYSLPVAPAYDFRATPNYNKWGELIAEFESSDLHSMNWGDSRQSRLDGSTWRRSWRTGGAPSRPASGSHNLFTTATVQAGGSVSPGTTTALRKIAIRTNGVVCISERPISRQDLISSGQTSVIRHYGENPDPITEVYIDRPTFWGMIYVFVRDDTSIGEAYEPTLCFPRLMPA